MPSTTANLQNHPVGRYLRTGSPLPHAPEIFAAIIGIPRIKVLFTDTPEQVFCLFSSRKRILEFAFKAKRNMLVE